MDELERYRLVKEAEGRDPKYVGNVCRVVRVLTLYGERAGLASWESWKPADVALALNAWAKGVSRNTAHKLFVYARSYFRFLLVQEQRSVLYPAMIVLPKKAERAPRGLSYKDVQRFVAAPDPRTEQGIRDRAILATAYYAGLRVSELSRLLLADVRMEPGESWLLVEGKGHKDRRVPLLPSLRPYLQDWLLVARHYYRGREDRHLFLSRLGTGEGYALTPKAINQVVRAAAGKANLKGVNVHTLRHSVAYHLRAAGMPLEQVQIFLGHKWINQTAQYGGGGKPSDGQVTETAERVMARVETFKEER